MKSWIVALLALCLFMSCKRHLVKSKEKVESKVESATKVVDSVKVKTLVTTETEKIYGDTLKGLLHFKIGELSRDSIESNGVKVVWETVPNAPDATQFVRLKAISKPHRVIDKTTFNQDYKNTYVGTQKISKDSTSIVRGKEVKTEPEGFT